MTGTERRHLLEEAAATLAEQFDMSGLEIDSHVIQGCLDEMVKPEDNHLLQQAEATQQLK